MAGKPLQVVSDAPMLRGVKSEFRPKVQPGLSVTLTRLGHDILKAASARTGLSRSDIFEKLLRRYGAELENDDV